MKLRWRSGFVLPVALAHVAAMAFGSLLASAASSATVQVAAAPPAMLAIPAPPANVRWIAQSVYLRAASSASTAMPREACSFDKDIDPMLRIDDAAGTVACAESMVLVVPASVARVREALAPFLARQKIKLEPMRGNRLFAFPGWHPLLMAQRPDLRRAVTDAQLGPMLDRAQAEGALTEDEVGRLKARATAQTDRYFAEVSALPEFEADAEGYSGEVGRGHPRDNNGSGHSTRLQISDAHSFFGPEMAVVRLARLEAKTEWQERSGFMHLPFPLNLNKQQVTRELVAADGWTGVESALSSLARPDTSAGARGLARGLVVAERPADLMPAGPAPAAPASKLLLPTSPARDAEARFLPYDASSDIAGFSYPSDLLALPDGSLLLGGESWNGGRLGQQSVKRFTLDGSRAALRMEAVWDGSGKGGVELQRGWNADVWWRYRDASDQARMVRWSITGGAMPALPVPKSLGRAQWIVHPGLGPLFPNRRAIHGELASSGDPDRAAALAALAQPPADGSSPGQSKAGATIPVAGGVRQDVLRRISANTKPSALLRVRDAKASWWFDWSIYSTRFAGAALSASSATPDGDNDCYRGCLGSLEAGWLARKSSIGLPTRDGVSAGAPDRAAMPRAQRFESVTLTNLRTGALLHTIVVPGSVVEGIARSASGRLLAIASRAPDNYLSLVDLRAPARSTQHVVPDGAGSLERVAFSWDGKTLWGSAQRGLIAWPVPREQQDAAHGDAAPDQVHY